MTRVEHGLRARWPGSSPPPRGQPPPSSLQDTDLCPSATQAGAWQAPHVSPLPATPDPLTDSGKSPIGINSTASQATGALEALDEERSKEPAAISETNMPKELTCNVYFVLMNAYLSS